MTEAFTIRQATYDDMSVIVSHRRRMFEDLGHNDVARMDLMTNSFETWLRIRMTQGLYKGWFAENSEGCIVAGSGVWLIDWPSHMVGQSEYRGYILNVYTEPDYRKRGLAHQLTQTAMDWCWENDIDVVILHASVQGRPIYEGMGFKPTNEMRILKP